MTKEGEEILKELLIDEESILKELVDKAKKIFRIDKKSGRTVLLTPRTRLSDRELIILTLTGRYFANRLNLFDSDSMTVRDIAQELNMTRESVSARISDLRRERVTEMVTRGEYRINYTEISRLLDELSEKVFGKK